MDICGGPQRTGRSYKRFDPDLLRRYTTVAWFKYNLSFPGMGQKYGPYPLEIYGSGLWIARGWSVWIGALHAEPLPFTPGPGWAPSHHHEWIWITLGPHQPLKLGVSFVSKILKIVWRLFLIPILSSHLASPFHHYSMAKSWSKNIAKTTFFGQAHISTVFPNQTWLNINVKPTSIR